MFHEGEVAAQERAGFLYVRGMIFPAMTAQHQQFFADLPLLFIARLDATGAPQAAMLTHPAGFIYTDNAAYLGIDTRVLANWPLWEALQPGDRIGSLGLDFATRRRNRINGTVVACDDAQVVIEVAQSFGNCPQYIRRFHWQGLPAEAVTVTPLTQVPAEVLAECQTFFIATGNGDLGLDISHRGGPAGFLRQQGEQLVFADFPGNRYMNTLGNLLLAPRCALLLTDFIRGEAIHIQGEAQVNWLEDEQGRSQREVVIQPTRIDRLYGGAAWQAVPFET